MQTPTGNVAHSKTVSRRISVGFINSEVRNASDIHGTHSLVTGTQSPRFPDIDTAEMKIKEGTHILISAQTEMQPQQNIIIDSIL